MHTLLLVIHLIACLLLVGAVLMQSGKGGGLGSAMGGGGGETFFGGRGAAPFLTRATTVLAVVFMMTSLSLALISGKDRRATSAIEKAMQQEQKTNQQPVSRPGELPVNQMPEAPSGK